MEHKTYIKSIIKKLNCSKKKKKEIQKELESDIHMAMENGESLAAIYQRMGSPIEIAEDFNNSFSKQEQKAGKREKAIKITAIILGIVVLLAALVLWYLPKSFRIEDSKLFSSEVLEEQAKQVIGLVNNKDYEILQKEYCTAEMAPYMTEAVIEGAKQQVGNDWGTFDSYGSCYMVELHQMWKKMAVVQVYTSYENIGVLYRISFDKNLKMTGFYMFRW